MHHNGVVPRQKKLGGKIKSKMYQVHSGQFILSGIDARNGAFGVVPDELEGAIVSNDFWYFELDESIIKRDFFYWLSSTSFFLEACIKSSEGTTNRRRLQKDRFFNFEFYLPKDISDQESLLSELKTQDLFHQEITEEISHQQKLLQKLRQSILQDAVQGKLTKQWRKDNPDVEPASELLKRIKEEKETLIKEKKIRKTKTIPPISEEEKYFELPLGWSLCRMVDIFKFIDYRGKTPIKTERGFRLITAKNIRMGFIDNNPIEYISEELYKTWMVRGFPKFGDLLFVTEGHTMGFVAKVDLNFRFALAQRTINLQPFSAEYGNWIFYLIMSPFFQKLIKANATGAAARGIKSAKLKALVIPMPPPAEQYDIVDKVDKMLTLCNQLEEQINQSKSNSEVLMQTVLKEAFEN